MQSYFLRAFTKYHTVLFFLFLVCSGSKQVFAQNESAWDTAKMRSIVRLASASLDLKPQTTDSFARLLYAQALAVGNIDYMGKAASLISISEVKLKNSPSLSWYDTAINYLSQTKNDKWIANTNVQIGNSFGSKLQYELGIRYLLKAADNFVQLKDTAMLLSTYTALSNTFNGFGDFRSEKKYAERAVALLHQIKDKNLDRRWGVYATLANSFYDNKEYDKALALHMDNIKNASNDWVFFLSYNNVGSTLLQMKSYTEAEVYFLKSVPYAHKINDDYSFATIYNNLSRSNFYLHKYTQAKQYLSLALGYAEKNHFLEKSLDVYETGALLETALNNPKAALEYFKKRSVIKDSLLNAERFRTVYNMHIKYESEEKEKDNQRLQYANTIKTIEKERAESDNRKLLIGGIATLFLLTVIFLLTYRNKLIKTKLHEDRVFTKAMIEGEQNERIRIARDLHDGIGQMLSVVKMQLSSLRFEEQTQEKKNVEQTQTLLDKTIQEVRHISHNLIPEELTFGIVSALEEMCNRINNAEGTVVNLSVDEELKNYDFSKQFELSLYRIVQEVLNNMLKHASANEIKIDIALKEQTILLDIRDDGKGFDPETIKESKGLGWKNIFARVRLLNGKMDIYSERIKGTQIQITLPQ